MNFKKEVSLQNRNAFFGNYAMAWIFQILGHIFPVLVWTKLNQNLKYFYLRPYFPNIFSLCMTTDTRP